MSVYLRPFHGRNSPDEELNDWGFEGPEIGPLDYVHTTYMCHVKFACDFEVLEKFFPEEAKHVREFNARYNQSIPETCPHELRVQEDLLIYDGKYYGDWSVYTK